MNQNYNCLRRVRGEPAGEVSAGLLLERHQDFAPMVVFLSHLYDVSQDYILDLVDGAIANAQVIEEALVSIGETGGFDNVAPWLNVAVHRAVAENTSVEQAVNDTGGMIRGLGEDGFARMATRVEEEIGQPFNCSNPLHVFWMVSIIEEELVLNIQSDNDSTTGSNPKISNWTLSPRAFNMLRDSLALLYAGVNFSNYLGGTSSLVHAAVDAAILWIIIRPIIDMGILILQRTLHNVVVEDGDPLTMGDEPKASFYSQFFGRLPEWIEGNTIFLMDEWWPRTLVFRMYQQMKGIPVDRVKPELTVPGQRTISNILRPAYIPPMFGIYILNRLSGSVAGTLMPTSPILGNILFGLSMVANIMFLGKVLAPIVSKRSTFGEDSVSSLIASVADSAVEFLISTFLLLPMNYYLPLFHLRALKNIRKQRLEGKIPKRTPGDLVTEMWQLESVAESYKIQAPTVGIGTVLGLGLLAYHPFTALLSFPIWLSMIVSPYIAYLSQPEQ